jgi:hypothetical protein
MYAKTMIAHATLNLLPTRILCLFHSTDGSLEVKLQESKATKGRYASLSHQWGIDGSEKGKTASTSFGDMLRRIAWTNIPKTFQHVIVFIYTLEIRYLWVNSYWFIQADLLGLNIDSKKMANAFQNTCITIAATAVQHNEAGCFWAGDDVYE